MVSYTQYDYIILNFSGFLQNSWIDGNTQFYFSRANILCVLVCFLGIWGLELKICDEFAILIQAMISFLWDWILLILHVEISSLGFYNAFLRQTFGRRMFFVDAVVVQLFSYVWLFSTPWTPGFSVLHHLPELAQTHVQWVNYAIQPSHLLLSLSPSAFSLSQN